MIPYASLGYFGVLCYVALPTVFLRLWTRLRRGWILVASAAMLTVQYWSLRTGQGRTTLREVWLLLGYALLQWLVARGYLAQRRRSERPWAYYGALGVTLAPLVATRLVPLVAPAYLISFLGLSYMTFRSLDVVLGIHDRQITALPPALYLAYLLFFPTISSGPIDRYRRFVQDWQRDPGRAELPQDLDQAVQRVFTGLLYKFILAVLIKRYWLDPLAHAAGLWPTISYMYAYSLYLFFDFAGYSAFAVGVSYLFGIHTPDNFDRPFLARDMRDFWSRWHISLSAWLRDHVYTRFVLAALKGRWFKSKRTASYLGLFLCMGLMGVWHGSAWRYLIYGLYHALLLIGNDIFDRQAKRRQVAREGRGRRVLMTLVTCNLACFGLLIFSGRLG